MVDPERALRDLSGRLDIDDSSDIVPAVLARIDAGEVRRAGSGARWVFAVAAAVLACAITFALPGPRRAVADLLGIGGVHLRYVDSVAPGVSHTYDLGRAVSIGDLRAAAHGWRLVPADTGPPAAGFVGRPPGAVTAVWAPSRARPELGHSGIGLLVTAFAATTDRALVEKEVPPGTSILTTEVGGHAAFWIEGPHVFRFTRPDGTVDTDSTRLAANTLIWVDQGVTYRLESALPLDAAVALAESLQAL